MSKTRATTRATTRTKGTASLLASALTQPRSLSPESSHSLLSPDIKPYHLGNEEGPSSPGLKSRPAFIRHLTVDVSAEPSGKLITQDSVNEDKPAPSTSERILTASNKLVTKGLQTMVTGGANLAAVTGSTLTHAAGKLKQSGEAFLDRQRRAADRTYRRINAQPGLQDALLHVAGSLTHLPVVDRQWYVGIFPRGSVIKRVGANVHSDHDKNYGAGTAGGGRSIAQASFYFLR